MKKLLIPALACALLLASCGNGTSTTTPTTPNTPTTPTTGVGIQTMTGMASLKDTAVTGLKFWGGSLSSAGAGGLLPANIMVDAAGNYTAVLVDPASNMTAPISAAIFSSCPGTTFSDSSARITHGYFISGATVLAANVAVPISDWLVWADRPVTVSGSCSTPTGGAGSIIYQQSTKLSLVQGWNLMRVTMSGDANTSTTTFATSPANGTATVNVNLSVDPINNSPM
ncbi:hypothetical protein [Deinococcus cavernae]|nr:hypothetical protein [Deinococcus cavernae]